MKTDNLQVAERLSKITGRPLEEFYDKPVEQPEENKTIRSKVKAPENPKKDERGSARESVSNSVVQSKFNTKDIQQLAKEWKAEVNIYGNGIVKQKRQMTRKEFLELRKGFKTAEEFMRHPLLLVMFRSENQLNPAFPHWCDDVIKYIESNNKEKK